MRLVTCPHPRLPTDSVEEPDFGASNVMVKGHGKVTLHLMLGVVILFAEHLLRLIA